VRDVVRFGYPFAESIRSILPVVDEFVVNVGDSSDDTLERVRAIDSPKLVVFEGVWDKSLWRGGRVMAHQTNLALDRCTGDWCFYLQADEVVHENDLDRIAGAMKEYLPRRRVEGLTFRYRHFKGSYDILNPLAYRKQVRIVRNHTGVRSVKDACGFARDGRRLRARPSGAWVYHYGWVRPPYVMAEKRRQFRRFYWEMADSREGQPDVPEEGKPWEYDFSACVPYSGSHPAVMQECIAQKDWPTPAFRAVPLWRNRAWWRGILGKNVPWLFR